jgi:8-hydroxy-5-deazaflavin:NADPH oxidoreductase
MRIGIIGAGNVGGTLGRRWAGAGHEVVFGTRHPGRVGTPPGTRAARVREAAEHGEVVVLATPWDGVREALAAAGDLAGKVLLDCTNPLAADLSGLAIGHTTSAGEQVAALSPGARVVKVFNSTGAGNMADPLYGEQAATMLYCGDDGEAKGIAARLTAELGFEPVDAGPLRNARLLEPLAMLWISLAYVQGLGPGIAFKLLRR